ncbi:PAQR family membrane homeostasis protein TrhA [Tropicimonas aquimaris]|uniref:Hemolysin III family protein n=1 Tax=Tropicimonas aquimaris TaxID=914152 RepID=A0ABW3IUZ8_9RHOB
MLRASTIRPAYSRAERISDGVVHVVGIGFAVIVVPILIGATVLLELGRSAIVGVSIYGAALIVMLTCSALYNMIDSARWTGLLRRLDHTGIYVKIAGTYTPFLMLSGSQPVGLMAGLWGTATFGSALKFLAPGRFRWLSLVLYLGMGWAAVFAGRPMLEALPGPVVALMAAGGITYTLGVVFHLRDRMLFHNTIWHVFVLTGSILFFAAVATQVFAKAALAAS